MLKIIKNKLSSNNGASFAIAMVLFLAACMVSVVTIAAANASSRSVYRTMEVEQNYLSVSSAASYVRDELNNSKFKVTKTKDGVLDKYTAEAKDGNSKLNPIIDDLLVRTDKGFENKIISYTITVDVVGDYNFENVQMTITDFGRCIKDEKVYYYLNANFKTNDDSYIAYLNISTPSYEMSGENASKDFSWQGGTIDLHEKDFKE